MSLIASINLENMKLEDLASAYNSSPSLSNSININGFDYPKSMIREKLQKCYPFLNFYFTTTDEYSATKALAGADSETLFNLFYNWHGTELIIVDSSYVHEAHLYHELRHNRGYDDLCYC